MNKSIEKINKILGKKAAFMGSGSREKIDSFSTGIIGLDYITGIGGMPKGRIVNIAGLYSSGKTSLCLQIIQKAQEQGIQCAFIDAEFTFSQKHAKKYNVNTENLIVIHPDCGEEAFSAMEILLEEGCGLIVVDSTSALVPKAEIEADPGTPPMARQARLISQGMRKTINLIRKNNACVIYISQMRQNIMATARGSQYTTTGGMALDFYTSLKIELARIARIMSGKKEVGRTVRFRTTKNKLAEPKEDVNINFFLESGFSKDDGLLSLAEEAGVIQREANSRYFNEEKIGVGEDKCIEEINSRPDLKEAILLALAQSGGKEQSQESKQ